MFTSFFHRCCLEKTKSIASNKKMKDLHFHFREWTRSVRVSRDLVACPIFASQQRNRGSG